MLGTSRFVIRHLRTIGALLFVFLYSASISLATPPTTKYSPGDTLDPLCTPGSTNCSVQILPSQTSQTNKLLTTSGSVTSWTDTLTGISLSGATNTLSNIGNASLTNSTISINGTPVALGGSVSNLALTTNPLSQFAATTSSQLAGVITDETGTGSVVYSTSPTLTTPTFTGDSTTGTINGQTISSAANFTGSMSVAGNVGVGTVAPNYQLTLKPNSVDNGISVRESDDGNDAVLIYASTTRGRIDLLSGGTNGIVLNAGTNANSYFNSGNVGIGTTSPEAKLSVKDGLQYFSDTDVGHGMTGWFPADVYGVFSTVTATNGGFDIYGLSDADAKGFALRGVIGSADPADTTPAVAIHGYKKNTTSPQDLGSLETVLNVYNGTSSVLMTVLGSGNVGIGTTTPLSKLEVAQSSGTNYFRISRAGFNTYGFSSTNNGTSNGLNIFDVTNNASRIFIDNAGSVGIGTTTPARIFTINGGASSSRMLLQTTASGATIADGAEVAIDTSGNVDIWNYESGYMRFATANIERLRIDASGNISIPGLSGVGNRCVYADSTGQLNVKGFDCGSASGGDNLGDHTATQNVLLNGNWLSNDGGSEGIRIDNSGNVGVGTATPATTLDVNGGISIQSNNNLTWGGAYGAGIPTISGAIGSAMYFYPTGSSSGITVSMTPTVTNFLTPISGTTATLTGTAKTLQLGAAASEAGAGLLIAGSAANKNWFIGNQYNVNAALEFTPTASAGGTTPGTTPKMILTDTGNLTVGSVAGTGAGSLYAGAGTFTAATTISPSYAGGSTNDFLTVSRTGGLVAYVVGYDSPNTEMYAGTSLGQGLQIRTNNVTRMHIPASGAAITTNNPLSVTGDLSSTGVMYATQTNLNPATNTSNMYSIINSGSGFAGQYALQAGAGSSGFGGSLTMYGHSHATKPGWVTAGISVSSGGKFSVQNAAIGAGTDIFTVDASGNMIANGTGAFTGTVSSVSNMQIKNDGYREILLSAANGSNRWDIYSYGADETGSGNAGGNFNISNYADNGSYISTPFSINRATGISTFSASNINFAYSVGAIRSLWGGGYGGIVQMVADNSTSARYSRIGISDSVGSWIGGMTIADSTAATFTNSITAAATIQNPEAFFLAPTGTGGWARTYGFKSMGGTNRGGFGAFGADDTITYYYVGQAYNDNKLQIDASTGAATFPGSVTGNYFDAIYSSALGAYNGSLDWNSLQLGNNGDNFIVGGHSVAGGNLQFYVNNTNRAVGATPNGTLALTLASAGTATFSKDVTVGSTSTPASLSIPGTGSGFINFYGAYSGSPSNPGFNIQNNAGTTTLSHNSNGGSTNMSGSLTVGSLLSCGGIQTNGSGTMSCTSDETLKDKQGAFTSGLDAIRQINPESFSWKADSGLYDDGIIYYGFIAQNVQAALPEAISTSATGKLQVSQLTLLAATINAVKDIDFNIMQIQDFDRENTWRDSLTAWLGNATNRITRIFTGEICLSEAGEEAECINRAQLQQLKELIATPPSSAPGGDPVPDVVPPPEPPLESCSDGIQNQDETDIDIGGVCTPIVPDETPVPDPVPDTPLEPDPIPVE